MQTLVFLLAPLLPLVSYASGYSLQCPQGAFVCKKTTPAITEKTQKDAQLVLNLEDESNWMTPLKKFLSGKTLQRLNPEQQKNM